MRKAPFDRSILLTKFLPLILLLTLPFQSIIAQGNFCEFEDHLGELMIEYPELIQQMGINENVMEEMMTENPLAIMNNTVYTIPVVFHIMYLPGDNLGVGSNISDARVNQALQDLNDDFRDAQGVGYDTEIQFCLATRDPDGNSTTGINRIETDILNYENIGIAQNFNEVPIKALSRWSNLDYLNIWVVHSIAGGNGGTILGYATFPGTDESVDGIVMRADATGVPAFSGVIAHEGGHFLNLYHTFQGGSQTTCPPSDPDLGDMVADTPPHKLVFGGCDETGINECDNNSSLDLVVHNHMNYTDNDCRNEFTPDQAMRMRCALMTLRPTLMNSLGCSPPCMDVTAQFESPANGVEDVELTFSNLSQGANAYTWIIDGVDVSTEEDLKYTFSTGGVFQVCLRATDGSCSNQICKFYEVFSADPCYNPTLADCEYLLNGDFSQTTIPIGKSLHYGAPPCGQCNAQNNECGDFVCNWNRKNSSPFFCSDFIENSMAIGSGFYESFVAQSPINLVDNEIYTLSFDYYANVRPNKIPNTGPTLDVGFSESNGLGLNLQNDIVFASLTDIPYGDFDGFNVRCHPPDAVFNTYELNFIKTPEMGEYLYFFGRTNNINPAEDYIFLKNVQISQCEDCTPIPEFEVVVNDCEATLTGMNFGDEGIFNWNFGDGSTATGHNVIHQYLFDGDFTVCLTITCLNDSESSSTVCQDITIDTDCDDCEMIDPVTAILCETNKDTLDSFIANFEFKVDKGYAPCITDSLFMMSNQVDVEVTSFYIDESDPDFDVIHASILVTPPLGYDFEANGAFVYLTLCTPDGEMVCLTFALEGNICDSCEKINIPGICNDSMSTDSTFVYEGSDTITIPEDLHPCGVFTSDLNNITLTTTQISSTEIAVNYSISTTVLEPFETSALLCFESDDGDTYCVTLILAITETCTVLPEDCVRQWAIKTMRCTDKIGNDVIFDFAMNVASDNYSICPDGLFATINGGEVIVNSYAHVGNNFIFDLDLILPSGYDQELVYNLRVFFCNGRGDYVCYLFPLKLPCDADKGDGNKGDGRSSYINDLSTTSYSIVPNPATDYLMINSFDANQDLNRRIEIVDQAGRIVKRKRMTTAQEIINLDTYYPGVYFVRIFENDIPTYIDRVVIMK